MLNSNFVIGTARHNFKKVLNVIICLPSHDTKVKNNVFLSINLSNNEMDKLIRFLSFVLNGLVNYFVEFICYHAHSGGITKTS